MSFTIDKDYCYKMILTDKDLGWEIITMAGFHSKRQNNLTSYQNFFQMISVHYQ